MCWLKIRIDNLSRFAFYLVIVVLEKHFNNRNQFFYLKKIKIERTKIEKKIKNSSPFVLFLILSTLILFLSCFRSSNFFYCRFVSLILFLLRFKIYNLFWLSSSKKKSCDWVEAWFHNKSNFSSWEKYKMRGLKLK